MSDRGRGRLAPLVPAVVGLDSDDPRLHALIARRCALTALPVSPIDEQRALAVALLTAERTLARLEDRPLADRSREVDEALAAVPHVRDWAVRFAGDEVPRLRTYRRHAAPTAVRCAVQGVLAARPADVDGALVSLLAVAIDEAQAFVDRPAAPVDQDRWSAACDLLAVEAVAG
jgi:hypothetical protein